MRKKYLLLLILSCTTQISSLFSQDNISNLFIDKHNRSLKKFDNESWKRNNNQWEFNDEKNKLHTIFEDDFEYLTVKGGHKFCIGNLYFYKFGEKDLKSKLKTESHQFDDKGNLTEGYIYNIDGKVKYSYLLKYKYDIKRNIVEQESYNTDGSNPGKTVNVYDLTGNRTEIVKYNSDGTILEKFARKFDANGNEIERSNYGRGGFILCKINYKYNYLNQLIEEEFTSLNRKDYSKQIYKYDANKNRIETVKYNHKGEFIKKVVFKYNKSIFISNKIIYYSDGADFMETYKYDDNGNKIEILESRADGTCNDNISFWKFTFKYDLRGNMVSYERHSAKYGDLSYKATYNYDDNNNIVEISHHSELEPIYSIVYVYSNDKKIQGLSPLNSIPIKPSVNYTVIGTVVAQEPEGNRFWRIDIKQSSGQIISLWGPHSTWNSVVYYKNGKMVTNSMVKSGSKVGVVGINYLDEYPPHIEPQRIDILQ